MKQVYCIESTIRFNGKAIANGVDIACTTMELAKREFMKSQRHLIETADEMGHGKCVKKFTYCGNDGAQHLILTYEAVKVEYIWRIFSTDLIES